MKNPDELLHSLRARQTSANTAFQPLFYRLSNANQRHEFNQLLTTPGLIVVDQILEQFKELTKYKSPGHRFSTNELETRTKEFFVENNRDEYGVWVYYPWSNRLVHCLEEQDFIDIRTSRNQYKITREERDVLMQKKIGVIGLSVGQSVSVTIAMERICGELRLADFDTLELNNLNRIRAGIHNLGLPKVYSVAREIAEIDPFLKVVCFTNGLTEENMDEYFTSGGKLDLLIEESDGFDIKILSRYKARALQIPVLMEASDRCMVDVERFDLEPDRGILHGIVDHLNVDILKSLQTNEEKIPYMLDVLGIETSSVRLKASMVEMNQTINTWPQLASAVTMGGGITADVARRLLLNQYTGSGRFHVDIEELIGDKKGSNPVLPASDAGALSPQRLQQLCAQVKDTSPSAASNAELEQIVAAAAQAPSFANRQPWRWASFAQKLFLFHNKAQSAFFIDPANLSANTSLGTTLENALLKAGELGFAGEVAYWPLPGEDSLVACITFSKTATAADPLAAYITTRHTNRKPGNGELVNAHILNELQAAVAAIPGAALNFSTGADNMKLLGEVVGAAERVRLLQPLANHETFTKELLWPKGAEPITEGIDMKTFELPVLAETAFKVVADPRVAGLLNTWEKGILFEKMAAHNIGTSSAIGLISMAGGKGQSGINAGRAAQKAWLAATKNNLAFQPICIPLYLFKYLDTPGENALSTNIISELKRIQHLFSQVFTGANRGEDVFMFRLFHAATAASKSLHKPLNEVYFKF